jgi:phage shock protein A
MRAIGVVIVLLVLVLGIVWFFPGLRHRGREMYREYGGWTEEARKGDPVGFIEYAEKTLQQHLRDMQSTQQRMKDALASIKEETAGTTRKLQAAENLAETFRTQYKQALGQGTFPISVAGRTYTQEETVAQVGLILRQRDSYENLLAEFDSVQQVAEKRMEELVTQIGDTKASLAMLPAKREIARLNELTGSTEELMSQVNDLIMTNGRVLDEDASPVRTVEELIQGESEAPDTGSNPDARAFLEGGQ